MYLGGNKRMDLSAKTKENLEYMVNQIIKKLNFINIDVMKARNYDIEHYDSIHSLYQLIMKRDSFSPSEMEAIAEELGSFQK